MGFEFECPRGHLLEAEPDQAGEQHVCPACGITFVVPDAPESAQHESAQHESALADSTGSGSAEALPRVGPTEQTTPKFDTASEPDILHIPCPNGHPLETPREMLGQDVLCPYCASEFRLRESDSLESQKKALLQEDRRQHKLGKTWLNWAVTIAVVVVLGLLVLILSSRQ